MENNKEFLEFVEQIKEEDLELYNELIYLRPYYVYNRLLNENAEEKDYIKNLNYNGKTSKDYYAKCPKITDFPSTRNYYAALARYDLSFLENAKQTEKFKEDYNILVIKLLHFVNNMDKLSIVEIVLEYANFARDIVALCAKHQIPYLGNIKFASQRYEISLEKARKIIKKKENGYKKK